MAYRALAALVAASMLVASLPALAAGTVTVEGAYANATPPGAPNGAAYFTLRNGGKEADRIIGASTSIAQMAELHTHTIDAEGVARMREVEAVTVPAGGSVAFAPGGNHLMLMELAAPLKAGEHFPLTLRLERAGDVTVDVEIRQIGAKPAAQGHKHGTMN